MKICSFDVGIKNLAYCIIDKNENDFNILYWDIINISNQEKKERLTCNYIVNNKKCNKYCNLYYFDNDIDKKGLCKEHQKEHKKILHDRYVYCSENNICNYKSKRHCKNIAIHKCDNIDLCEQHSNIFFKKLLSEHKLFKLKNQNVNHESNFVLAKNMYEKLDNLKFVLDVDEVLIENQPTLKNPVMKNIASLLFGYFILRGVIEHRINVVKFISPLNKMKINSEISKDVLGKYEKKYEIKKATKNLGITYTKIILSEKQHNLNLINTHSKIDDLCDAFLQGYNYLYKNDNYVSIDKYQKFMSTIILD